MDSVEEKLLTKAVKLWKPWSVSDLSGREQRSWSFSQHTEFARAIVACKLIDIKKLLVQSGTSVGVIEMLPRVDVNLALIAETYVILKQHFERNLFSSMTIYIKTSLQRGLSTCCISQLDLLRGMSKACKTCVFSAWL